MPIQVSTVISVASAIPTTADTQLRMIKHPWPAVKRFYASYRGTAPLVIDELCNANDHRTRSQALARTNNADIHASWQALSSTRALALARNPLMPAGMLEKMMETSDQLLVRALLSNPSLPREAATAAAKKWSMKDLFTNASPSKRAADSGVIIEAHPYLADIWAHRSSDVSRRTLARSPEITLATVEKFRGNPRQGTWLSALAANPYAPLTGEHDTVKTRTIRDNLEGMLGGMDALAFCNASLENRLRAAVFGSYTLDILLARMTALEPEVAKVMISRSQRYSRQGDITRMQPDTVGKLVENSTDDIAIIANETFAGTLVLAASESSPKLAQAATGAIPSSQRTAEVAPLVREYLGDSVEAWDNFKDLSSSWGGTVPELIRSSGLV